MPFRVAWSDEAKRRFGNLAARDVQKARKLVGSFRHDRWQAGPPDTTGAFGDIDVRALRNDDVTLVYRIDEINQVVEILTVRSDES